MVWGDSWFVGWKGLDYWGGGKIFGLEGCRGWVGNVMY